jgi:hypothetical protein
MVRDFPLHFITVKLLGKSCAKNLRLVRIPLTWAEIACGKHPATQILRVVRTKSIAGNAPFPVCIVMIYDQAPASIFNYVAACPRCVR